MVVVKSETSERGKDLWSPIDQQVEEVAVKVCRGAQKEEEEPSFTIENNVLVGRSIERVSKYTNVGKYILDCFKKNPNAIGQVDGQTEEKETFEEMADRTVKCALWLKKQGVRPGDVVAVCTHNHMDSFVPCIAAMCVGAIFNCWDYEMNSQMARHYMNLTKPKVIFTNESATRIVLEVMKIEMVDCMVVTFGDYPGTTPFSEVLEGHSKSEVSNFECTEISNREPATILFSSGTTGLPKGVEISHFTWLDQLENDDGLRLSKETPLWFSSLYWISGVLLMLQSISCCITRIVYPDFDEETCCKLVEKFKVTWLFVGTSMANRLVKSGFLAKYDMSSLKIIFTGGASLKREAQAEFKKFLPHTEILQAYGMTELGGLATAQTSNSKNGSCGVVIKEVQIKIIDVTTGKTLGANQHGEICIKTPRMMIGYHGNPEATKNTIDEEGWLHSGDLGYYDENGEIYIVERLKELIKYRGHQISPGEIENVIQIHPDVKEVAVLGVPHPTDDEHPVAFVSKVPGAKVTEKDLIDLVANNLMDHNKLRAGVVFLSKLPHTTSGKISRKELRTMAKELAARYD